jgi:hypothetical protein
MPFAPPVMIATFPVSEAMVSIPLALSAGDHTPDGGSN